MPKLIDYLLSKGDVGLIIIVFGFVAWFLMKQLASNKEVIKGNTASNITMAHSLDKMAEKVAAQNAQNAEFHRAILEVFSRNLRK